MPTPDPPVETEGWVRYSEGDISLLKCIKNHFQEQLQRLQLLSPMTFLTAHRTQSSSLIFLRRFGHIDTFYRTQYDESFQY